MSGKKCDKKGSRRLNYDPGDVCCVSTGLNMQLMCGCGKDRGTRGEWAS